MAGIDFNLSLYKAPSNEIVRHRKEFYGLWKRCDDQTTTWLNRIQSKIDSCDFPTLMSPEYLLIDKFVCELDEDERAFIQSVNTWTLSELMEYFEHRKMDTDTTSTGISIDVHPWMPPVVTVKSEFVADNEHSENRLSNEFADEESSMVKSSISYGVKTEEEEEEEEEDDPLMTDAQQFEPNPDDSIEMSIDIMKTEFENYEYSTDGTSIAAEIGNDNDEIVVNSSNKRQSTDTLTTAKRYACDQCDKLFSTLGSLNRHKKEFHQGIRSHTCQLCDKRFESSFKLKIHLNWHNGERPYKCDQCSKSYTSPSNLGSHKKKNHEEKYEYSTAGTSIAAEIGNDNDEIVVDSSNKRQSTDTLTTAKRHACDQCDKSFSTLGSMKMHKKVVHQRILPHACQLCGKGFVSASKLKAHLNAHNGRRPYKCDQCSKSFAAPSNLIEHKKRHNKKRKYECDQCSKSFADHSSIARHKIRFHQALGPRAKVLVEHSEVLLPYQCDYCNKRFHSNADLDRHSLTHAGPSLDTINHLQINDVKCEFENYEYSTVDTVDPAEFSNDTDANVSDGPA